MKAKLKRLKDSKKKYIVVVYKGNLKKTIKFGAAGYSDFTMHKDEERKKRYIERHKKNEDFNDPFTAGFWSRWLLWEKPTIRESKEYITKRFNIEFS